MTKDFNRLQGSETKLKNEVEELKANNIEKDTRIVYLEGQVSEFVSSLEKAHEEAIASFERFNDYKRRVEAESVIYNYYNSSTKPKFHKNTRLVGKIIE